MKTEKKSVLQALWLCVLALLGAAGCQREAPVQPFAATAFESYRDVPGVTQAEIDAIAALRQSREFFTFIKFESQEAFTTADGTVIGFAPLLADFLSGFFSIPFVLRVDTLEEVHSSLDALASDFASDLTPTPERRERYFMSHPIFQRQIGVFSHVSFPEFENKSNLNGRRVGHLRMAATYQTILNIVPGVDFQPVGIPYLKDVPAALESGYIDAFVLDYPFAMFANPDIRVQILYPFAISHGSFTTANPDLAVIISVFDKFIEARGINNIYLLHRQGFADFASHLFRASLTAREAAFIDDLAALGAAVPAGLEPDNYPISFYNPNLRCFQGIIPDFLDHVSLISGIRFEAATNRHSTRAEIDRMLETGEVSFVSERYYLPGTAPMDPFLLDTLHYSPFFRDNFILMSRVELPNLQIHQVMHAHIGVVSGSIYETVLDSQFPYLINVFRFESKPRAMEALSSGGIDLLITRASRLLAKMNFHENTGYKANITLSEPLLESFIAFNREQDVLQSIIGKASIFIDIDSIVDDWSRRYFDYGRMAARRLLNAVLIFTIAFAVLFATLLVLFFKNRAHQANHNRKTAIINALYMAMPDTVFYKDMEGRYIGCNRSFEEYTEKSEAEIIGKTPYEIYSDLELAEESSKSDMRVFSENTVVKQLLWRRFKDGSRRLHETVKAPLVVEGQTVGLLGTGRDITAYYHAMEAVKEADKKKKDFLAHMSHEIRTPMNAIMGMAELSLNAHTPSVIHEYVQTIKHASHGLLSIINDILDFSKIEAGKFEIAKSEYSLFSLLNDVISIIRVKAEGTRLRFMVSVDSKLPAFLEGDEVKIRQVLLNILNNAFKYTERGFVSLFVSGEPEGENSVTLTFQIADTGIGIKEENLDKLFEEYAQFDLEKNRSVEGTGLGLPIAAGFIKAMGGKVGVFSEYGRGSRFTITLPQKIRDRKPLAVVENPESKKILVFERREIYSNFIQSALSNLGVASEYVFDEAEFLEKCENGEFSFIFISSIEYERRKEALEAVKGKSKIVSILELGHDGPASGGESGERSLTLHMPFHSVTIASLLNNSPAPASSGDGAGRPSAKFLAQNASILVVDDIVTNLKVAQGLLSPYQPNVDICKSGATSVEAVKANRYDLIFMDHKMPVVDGIEATRRIRALAVQHGDAYFKDVPIIALTANAMSGSKEMFLENGFNDFLSKPIETVKLAQILEAWLPAEKITKEKQ